MYIREQAHVQKPEVSNPYELELCVAVTCLTGGLRRELGSSVTAMAALNLRAISVISVAPFTGLYQPFCPLLFE